MSLALAAVFGAAWLWLRIADTAQLANLSLAPLILLTSFLAQINGQLALFNLAPGFPLDGGRVFRAILWGATHDIRRATRWATRAGQLIAVILIGVGGWLFLSEFNGGGIWFALIGFFLWNAAGEGYRQTDLLETLRGVTVSQLMTREFQTVSPDLTLTEFIDQYLLPRRDQTFAVSDALNFQGIISIENLKRVPRAEWSTRRVREAMTPRPALQLLSPEQTAADAMLKLSGANATELPVMQAGQLAGFLGRAELERFLRLGSETKRA
jgi:hypothetical protein